MGADSTAPILSQDHNVDISSEGDQQPTDAPVAQPAVNWQRKLLQWLATNLHYFTFLPLITISILQDISLFLAALVCTGLVLLILTVSFCAHRAGFVKVSR